MKTLCTVVAIAAMAVALPACTTVVTADTSELEAHIAALQKRIQQLESKDTSSELVLIKSTLANHRKQITRLSKQRAAMSPPRPQPAAPWAQPGRPAPDRPTPKARRRPGADNRGADVDRHMRRARQLGKMARLDEPLTAELARVLKTIQDRVITTMKSIRGQKLSKEQAAVQREKVKQQNEALIAEFKLKLNEEQARKLGAVLKRRSRLPGSGRPPARAGRERGGKPAKETPERQRRGKQKKHKGGAGPVDEKH